MSKHKSAKNKIYASKVLVLLLSLTFIIPQTGCFSTPKPVDDGNTNAGYTKIGYYMDSVCQITVYGVDQNNLTLKEGTRASRTNELYRIIEESMFECERYEEAFDFNNADSIVSKINDSDGEYVTVDPQMIDLIKKGLEYGELTDGRFDITLGAVTNLWNFEWNKILANSGQSMGRITLPKKEDLEEAIKAAGYKGVEIEDNRVRLVNRGAKLDLGGLAKGYTAELLMRKLKNNGISSAFIDVGGCAIAIGGKAKSIFSEEETDFAVTIKDPTPSGKDAFGYVKCKNKAVVTTNIYELYFKVGGKEYHHIIDSKTGYPTNTDLISATVIMEPDRSVDAGVLSLTCLSYNYKEARKFIEGIEGAQAIFVDRNKNIYLTDSGVDFERADR